MSLALLAGVIGYPAAHMFQRQTDAGFTGLPIIYAHIAIGLAGSALAASAGDWPSRTLRQFAWPPIQAFFLAVLAFEIALMHSGQRDQLDLILIFGAGYACLTLCPPRDRIAVFFTVLVICGVGWFSGAGGGPDTFRRWVMTTFHLSHSTAETVVIAVRKTVHFSAYGVYGLSWRRYGWKMAIIQTFLLASFDEARQTTAGNRTGSPLDVLLDLSGAIVLLTLVHFATRKRARQPFHE
jgi:hypothetical protein